MRTYCDIPSVNGYNWGKRDVEKCPLCSGIAILSWASHSFFGGYRWEYECINCSSNYKYTNTQKGEPDKFKVLGKGYVLKELN